MSQRDTKSPEVRDLLSLMTADSGQLLPHADSERPTAPALKTVDDSASVEPDEELVSRRKARRKRRKQEKASEGSQEIGSEEVVEAQTLPLPEQKFFSVKQVAKRWAVSVPTIWRWSSLGIIPKPIALGPGTTRWQLEELEGHEASCTKVGGQ
jgi:prophage regulatory protein